MHSSVAGIMEQGEGEEEEVVVVMGCNCNPMALGVGAYRFFRPLPFLKAFWFVPCLIECCSTKQHMS